MITPPSGNGSYVLWGGQAPVPSGQKRGQSPRGSWPGSRPPTGPHAQTRGQTWRVVDERVDMTGLAAGAGIDEKMRGAVVVGNQGIEKMIPAAGWRVGPNERDRGRPLARWSATAACHNHNRKPRNAASPVGVSEPRCQWGGGTCRGMQPAGRRCAPRPVREGSRSKACRWARRIDW